MYITWGVFVMDTASANDGMNYKSIKSVIKLHQSVIKSHYSVHEKKH